MATTISATNGERIRMDASMASATDVCPICKSTAQTSPNLRFKVSPKCYHRICEGCVDRKFSAGKAQCPVSGCHQQLWKRDWKLQTFEDIQVEREVDIRRRIMRTLDLTNLGLKDDEGTFEDFRGYNDFLELREELAMNLIFNTDVVATNKKLREFEIANGLRKEKDDGGKAVRPSRKTGDYPDASGLIKKLRLIELPKARSPYNPFQGVSRDREYFTATSNLEFRKLDVMKKRKDFVPGGYDAVAYTDESLLTTFAGLSVFIDEEKDVNGDIALVATANTMQKASMLADDVF